jgi:hypothetical protein
MRMPEHVGAHQRVMAHLLGHHLLAMHHLGHQMDSGWAATKLNGYLELPQKPEKELENLTKTGHKSRV